MNNHRHECPFLNRSDPRCSGHFSLDRLRHVFQYCLDDYHACPLLAELLTERRLKRVALRREARIEINHAGASPVQVTVARRVHKPLAGAA